MGGDSVRTVRPKKNRAKILRGRQGSNDPSRKAQETFWAVTRIVWSDPAAADPTAIHGYIVQSNRIIYRLDPDHILIGAIVHGSRQLVRITL